MERLCRYCKYRMRRIHKEPCRSCLYSLSRPGYEEGEPEINRLPKQYGVQEVKNELYR